MMEELKLQEHSSSAFIPDEIWIKILKYVPLYDRFCNVQYVSKRLHFLVISTDLMGTVSFHNEIFMSDEDCLKILFQGCHLISNLSFNDCHWFSAIVFQNFPVFSNLNFLDISGCFLPPNILHHIFVSIPHVCKLALTINMDSEFLESFVNGPSLQPKLHLTSLHVELFLSQFSQTECLEKRFHHLKCFIIENLMSDVGFDTISFSCDWDASAIAKYLSIQSKYSIDLGCAPQKKLFSSPHMVCATLSSVGLHSTTRSLNNAINFNCLKFLSLPCVIEATLNNSCEESDIKTFPCSLPNLEVLIIGPPLFHCENENTESCLNKLMRHLVLFCQMPNLQCYIVDIGLEYSTLSEGPDGSYVKLPVEFFQQLSTMKNLKKANFRGLSLNLEDFLEQSKNLKTLESLSLPIKCDVDMQFTAMSLSENAFPFPIDIKSALYQISQTSRFLSTLELTLSTIVPENTFFPELPFENFPHLKALSLHDFKCYNSVNLVKSLQKLDKLRILVLSNVGIGKICEYEFIISQILPHFHLLTELKIKHDHFFASAKFFENLARCKSLEKLVVFSCFDQPSSMGLYESIKSLILGIPLLHYFVIDGYRNKFCYELYEKLDMLYDSLKKHGRVMAPFNAIARGNTDSNRPSCIKISHMVTSSIVSIHSPWSYYESYQYD